MCENGSWHTYGMRSVLPLEPGVTDRLSHDDKIRKRLNLHELDHGVVTKKKSKLIYA
jgi:hypothetical protein